MARSDDRYRQVVEPISSLLQRSPRADCEETSLIDRRTTALRERVAVVGVGDTDYPTDYRRGRQADGAAAPDGITFGLSALSRALDDAGLDKGDIDGLVVGPHLSYERTAEAAGLDLAWASQADAAHSIIQGAAAIVSGLANCVALVYGYNQRSAGVQYGGPQAASSQAIRAYVYYAPWGLTSQGGLYALMTNRYMQRFGLSERDLGRVAVAQREFAAKNDNAIMQEPISLDDYLSSRYIVEPLHLYDYCLVNDGGVALILTSAERADRLDVTPALIQGIGRHDLNRRATSLEPRLIDFYHSGHRRAAEQVYQMSDCGPADIPCVQIYDSFSSHIIFALEGFGFCPEGQALQFLGTEGAPKVNTSGGHLSESYMQGWNHQVEAVRQIRGQAGARQVDGCDRVQYICDAVGKVTTIIYSDGSA